MFIDWNHVIAKIGNEYHLFFRHSFFTEIVVMLEVGQFSMVRNFANVWGDLQSRESLFSISEWAETLLIVAVHCTCEHKFISINWSIVSIIREVVTTQEMAH